MKFKPTKEMQFDGEEGESLMRWTKNPDGTIQIESIDGVTMDDEDGGDPMTKAMNDIDEMMEEYKG